MEDMHMDNIDELFELESSIYDCYIELRDAISNNFPFIEELANEMGTLDNEIIKLLVNIAPDSAAVLVQKRRVALEGKKQYASFFSHTGTGVTTPSQKEQQPLSAEARIILEGKNINIHLLNVLSILDNVDLDLLTRGIIGKFNAVYARVERYNKWIISRYARPIVFIYIQTNDMITNALLKIVKPVDRSVAIKYQSSLYFKDKDQWYISKVSEEEFNHQMKLLHSLGHVKSRHAIYMEISLDY